MKDSWKVLVGTVALAVSVTQPAVAEPAKAGFDVNTLEAKQLVEVTYPQRALERGTSGACTIVFDIAPTGATENLRSTDCASVLFAREGKRVVSQLEYPSTSTGIQNASLTFRFDAQAVRAERPKWMD